MGRKSQEVAQRRYTLMWVPQGGRGNVRQVSVSLQQIRWFAIVVVFAVSSTVAGLWSMGANLPKSKACDALLEENLTLKSRLQDIERTLGEVEDQLRRLRMYDQQLDELKRQGFSGYGPIEPDELGLAEAELQSMSPEDGIVELDVDADNGDFGQPMHELDGLELSPVFLNPVDAWSQDVQNRAEHLLQLARDVEPQVGLMVESAEDARARRSAYPSVWPVEGNFTSGFGYRRSPFNRIWKFHAGIDISAPIGTKVRATASGVVERTSYAGGYGKLVEIDHGYGVKSRYAHNNRVFVKSGQVVQAGQVIATVGTTGKTTGPHLHFEVVVDEQKVDPMAYLPRRKLAKRANRRPAP